MLTWNDNEKKHNFLQHKENTEITKMPTTDGLKIMGKKVDLAVVFADIIRKGALPYEAENDNNKNSIKKDPLKRGQDISDIYILAELNAARRVQ